jgi:alkylation response protein AidB-like acyl-CoA dehydrogenase
VWWDGIAGQGLLGLHLPGEHGGGGGDLLDLAVVLEEAGRALLPDQYLPTVLAAAVLAEAGGGAAKRWLPALAEGSLTAALALHPGAPVLGADLAELLLIAVGADADADADVDVDGDAETGTGAEVGLESGVGTSWFVVESAAVAVRPLRALDLTRGLAEVGTDRAASSLSEENRLAVTPGQVRRIAAVLFAAEACGIAGWALDTAVSHARVREQFGQPIGRFQAVKHLCAQLLVRVERARAAVWQAARGGEPAEAEIAAALALEAGVENAKDCIQILGGIGFTWEHDAHLRLRRAITLRQLLDGDAAGFGLVARSAREHPPTRPGLELPPEAEEFRARPAAAAQAVRGLEPAEQRRRLAPGGWAASHLPPPYGLGADALQQLVVDEELRRADVRLPDLVIGNWVVPSLIAFGTPEQQQALLMPTLRGELTWCQLFSEPEAGSDLAALRTRAVRLPDGRWRVDGQKVWTSSARTADYGILLARTSPEKPKHKGLTYFLVDMRTTTGIDIRPLRELTGDAVFNEVFLDGVELPADAVVGEVDGGWRVARHTLGNERVHMADSSPTGDAVRRLLAVPGVPEDRVGRLVADEHVLACIDLRTALSGLDGLDPGAGASVRKLVSAPHAQRVAELALELCGPAGAVYEGPGEQAGHAVLMSRCLTIAGGTTQVQLNVVAERLLGLPRD